MVANLESFSRERVLETAERLFSRRGYSSVTLRDIAEELDMNHASLYYHFPGGKESLFLEVTERGIMRHGAALEAAIEDSCCDIRTQLRSVAAWFLSRPPLDLIRMTESDMPVLKPEDAQRLMVLVHRQILFRLQEALRIADGEGQISCLDPGLVAGGLVGLIESIHSVPPFALRRSREDMAGDLIDIVLRGLSYRGFAKNGSGEEQ
jgi:AcrR family transcriptional regulator